MDRRRQEILDAISEVFTRTAEWGVLGAPEGIVEKSSSVRELEGMALVGSLLAGSLPSGGIVIFENGLPFVVDIDAGQKTGCFLDQRQNHALAASYAKGARVLDAFCYTGGFAVHAARAGAASVTAVDSSAAALSLLAINAALSGVNIDAREADVFDFLRSRRAERYELLILDPPAFAKSHTSVDGALRGYKEINLSAMALLKAGGVLVSCSCSQAVSEGAFKRMIAHAARDAGRRLYQLSSLTQAPDHPVLVGYEESSYLKGGIYRVM
jgi:23S rRNA (cytosine1962-C5)-methyltransferase